MTCKPRECTVSWCVRRVEAHGLCDAHLRRKQRGKDLEAPWRWTKAKAEGQPDRDVVLATDEQVAILAHEAKRRGVQKADILREAIAEWCARNDKSYRRARKVTDEQVFAAIEELRTGRQRVALQLAELREALAAHLREAGHGLSS
ncbi:HNH endonuclease [Myxococcus phage Mx8]|uniref:p30 n=1 Tax=Myxococcus phage Mx8 TaxID=49964 RepID=Q94MT9_9CAUD|nr:HNH endonuclease [Myxococcus phage Mx8]AAK94365.1 p30 [Myxococcus phage Mx8]